MILNNILQEDNQTTIEESKYIEITKKTVKFGNDVYQFRNVSGFGVAEIKKSIPIKFVLILFIAGLFVAVIPGARMWGVLMVLLSIGIVVDEVFKPKRYGFKLYINSGDGKIFITNDIDGIKKVVSTLYEFMESNEEGSYAINIDQSRVSIVDQSRASIGVGYAEQVRADQLGGTVHNDS